MIILKSRLLTLRPMFPRGKISYKFRVRFGQINEWTQSGLINLVHNYSEDRVNPLTGLIYEGAIGEWRDKYKWLGLMNIAFFSNRPASKPPMFKLFLFLNPW